VSTTTSPAPIRRPRLAALLGAASLMVVSATYGQPRPPADASPPGGAPQSRVPVDPQTMTCSDLKVQMKNTGELNLLVGPRNGWGDTFYGPGVPQCQFYQMPQFAYVKARDGRCGIGYICVDKLSID